ncbi:hypothetical protein B5V00_11275 [Geothermobacter hydrogeniphilus]|uniref:Uncharacterized protein n=2 Tax=Geothermobacter hydrogeniphilus TaxID=1969733 RepID=A0A1X0Y232_9BACT|nr:hypothetical protein B5V00_11275 [Geothermobacter hydrogeniphilus]
MRSVQLGIFLSLLILCWGCDKQQTASAPQGADAVVKETRDLPPETGPGNEGGPTFTATLLPQPVTVTRPAIVNIMGCGTDVDVEWFVDNREKSPTTPFRLNPENFRANSVIEARVQCGDKQKILKAKVKNSPPRISRVMFKNPRVRPGEPITVIPQAHDPDGDMIYFDYRWTVNGEELFDVNGATLPGKYVKIGNEIGLDVTPRDDTEAGPVFPGGLFVIPDPND